MCAKLLLNDVELHFGVIWSRWTCNICSLKRGNLGLLQPSPRAKQAGSANTEFGYVVVSLGNWDQLTHVIRHDFLFPARQQWWSLYLTSSGKHVLLPGYYSGEYSPNRTRRGAFASVIHKQPLYCILFYLTCCFVCKILFSWEFRFQSFIFILSFLRL